MNIDFLLVFVTAVIVLFVGGLVITAIVIEHLKDDLSEVKDKCEMLEERTIKYEKDVLVVQTVLRILSKEEK